MTEIELKKDYCKVLVWSPTGWHRYQCSRKTVKDGFCKQHHPDSVKKREEEKERKFLEKQKNSPWHRLDKLGKEHEKLKKKLKKSTAILAQLIALFITDTKPDSKLLARVKKIIEEK
ncbi:MAG: hypothetical protein ACTSO3_01315 [Candidatus Heimdallarchaeaceae archaeon]